jgi:hypothetical protein
MTTVSGPGRSHRAQTSTPSIKHCLKATVQAADRLDDWMRRYVVEHPLRYGPTEFCADRPPRNRAVFVRDRSVWLSLGHCLRVQYDALAPPVPSHIAGLVEQLDTQE